MITVTGVPSISSSQGLRGGCRSISRENWSAMISSHAGPRAPAWPWSSRSPCPCAGAARDSSGCCAPSAARTACAGGKGTAPAPCCASDVVASRLLGRWLDGRAVQPVDRRDTKGAALGALEAHRRVDDLRLHRVERLHFLGLLAHALLLCCRHQASPWIGRSTSKATCSALVILRSARRALRISRAAQANGSSRS